MAWRKLFAILSPSEKAVKTAGKPAQIEEIIAEAQIKRSESDLALFVTAPNTPVKLYDMTAEDIARSVDASLAPIPQDLDTLGMASDKVGLKRSISSQVLTAGTGLMLSAGQAAVSAPDKAAKALSQACMTVLGLSSRDHTAHQSAQSIQSHSATESVPVYFSNRTMATVNVDPNITLPKLMEAVQAKTGLSSLQQSIAVEEEKVRLPSLNSTLQRLHLSIGCSRSQFQKTILTSVSFLTLPEVFSREVRGRGWLSWLRTSDWYQGMLEAQSKPLAESSRKPKSQDTCKVLIDHLTGQVRMVEISSSCSLKQLKGAVQQRFGIVSHQQRIIIKEKSKPGPVILASQKLALVLNACLKKGYQAMAGPMLRYPERDFTAVVHTTSGRKVQVTMNGASSVNQLRGIVEERYGPDEIAGIDFPAKLPPRRNDIQSDIIHSILV